jgi:hypothetical protein
MPDRSEVFSFLMTLMLPSVLLGVIFGFALVVVGWRRTTVGPVSRLESVPIFLCGVVALAAIVALIAGFVTRRDFHPVGLLMFALMLLLGSPILLWRSSWRQTAVGAATVAVSVLAFITGFSIGVLFIPLVIAMVFVSFSHLRRLTQVDSPV